MFRSACVIAGGLSLASVPLATHGAPPPPPRFSEKVPLQPGPTYLGFDPLLRHVDRVGLVLNDQVQDGCMPRPMAISEAAESELLRNGFLVDEKELEPPGFDYLYITAFGFSLDKSVCAVHLSIQLYAYVEVPYYPESSALMIGSIPVVARAVLLTGAKRDMQQSLRDAVIEHVNSIALQVIKAGKI